MATKKSNKKRRTNEDVYRDVTNRMIEALEAGRIPWHKPWVGAGGPMNYKSKRAYSGINIWILNAMPFTSPYWMSFKQAKEMGGNVRKGEKGTKIVFWNIFKKEVEENGEMVEKKFFFLKEFTVFNAEQIEGIEFTEPQLPEGAETVQSVEEVMNLYTDCPKTEFGGNRACYSPMLDFMRMPLMEQFNTTEGYYGTYFHEMTHSTGHPSRLNREGVANFDHFGSHQYSKEELVAEMGACFMMGIAGLQLEPSDNSKAYIQGWIEELKNKPKMLFQAAKQAEQACNYMLGKVDSKGKKIESTEANELNQAA